MSEDCLYVNVFTSERCLRKGKCAVMHYIYGGQFSFGSPRKFIPEIIVDNYNNETRDIVVVTFSYRMNVFGLLNLNYRHADLLSPNIAMHDILESLRWTKREIANFGGNPEKVSLVGHSSGSSATQILMVSPKAQGYFSQVVSMSGPGSIEPLPKNRNQRSSRKMAYSVGCVSDKQWLSVGFWENKTNMKKTLRCLRQVNASVLAAHLKILEDDQLVFHGLSQEIGVRAIVINRYRKLSKKYTPKYPVLTGTVSKEFRDARFVIDHETGQVNKLKLWLYCKRIVRQINYEKKLEAIDACVQEYSDAKRAVYLYEDAIYFSPHYLFAAQSTFAGAPAYLYQFEYDQIGTAFGHWPDNYGSGRENTPRHSQELVYLFGQNSGNFTQKDKRIQYLFSEIITNFIRTGDPNGIETNGFEVFVPARLNFFKIDFNETNNSSFIGNRLGYHKRAVQFWSGLMNRIGGPTRPLKDEMFVDDWMTSVYLDGDVEKVKHLLVFWSNSCKLSFCQVLFYVASAMTLIFFVLLLIKCCKKRRKKSKYQVVK